MDEVALTVFQGPAGDHNDLGFTGARAVGDLLAARHGLTPEIIGHPRPAAGHDWREALATAMPGFEALAQRLDTVFAAGQRPLAALSRCAASIATLPVVARHRPDACVVWFDAHADLNTPATTGTGYLGGLAISGPAGLWDSGLGAGLSLSNLVLVGQRDIDPAEQALIDCEAIAHLPPQRDLADRLRGAVAGRPVYMHLDCDVLDPDIVPTDYRCAHGLTLEDLHAACRVLAEQEVVGLEIAEFQSAWTEGGDPVSPAPLLDALAPVLERLVSR